MAKKSKSSDIFVSLTDDINLEDDLDAEDDDAVMDFMVQTMKSLRAEAVKQQAEVGINMFSSHNQQADFIAAAIQRAARKGEDE